MTLEGTEGTTEEQAATEETPSTAPSAPPGILPGGGTIRISGPGPGWEGDRLYQIYEFPPGSGKYVAYQFDNVGQLAAARGDDHPPFTVWSEERFNQQVIAEASAAEIIGPEQGASWQRYVNDVTRDAALAAGVNDPSLVGRIASNPEMQDIMVSALLGNWTQEQIRAAQRQTSFWKEELYPGIEKFYNRTSNPEQAWAEYRAQVAPALKRLGYEPGPDGSFKDRVGQMLEREIDADTFLSQVPTFIRASQNVEFAATLDRWAERELGRNVDFNDWFDLVAGESQPELEAVAEKAQIAYRSQQASVDLSAGQVRSLADRTQLSDAETQVLFSEVSRALLATDSFRRSTLTKDEVLSAFAGVDPDSDRSIEEVKLEVAKLAKEEDLFDEEKANFFVSFTQSGIPQRPGLQPLAPEGA